jgi:peptide chain release factor 2
VERLAAELAYVQMEVAGASMGIGRDQALLRITPVGRDSEQWASQLVAMYTAWASRKGYDYHVFEPIRPGEEAERRSAQVLPEPTSLFVKGSHVYEFLRGEAGLHKLNSSSAEDRQRNLVRVTVLLVDTPMDNPDTLPDDLVRLSASRGESSEAQRDPSAVVRVYHQGRYRFVRDVQTGVRITDVAAVLRDGNIDPFLLARLRQSADAELQG